MDYGEAIKRMEKMARERQLFLDEKVRPLVDKARREDLTGFQLPQRLSLELSMRDAEIESFGAQLNANPEFHDVLPLWKVQVCGVQDVAPAFFEEYESRPDNEVAVKEAFERLGGLPVNVCRALDKVGYTAYTRQIVSNGWKVFLRCTEGSSRRLCAVLHRKFRAPAKSGIVIIERRFVDYSMNRGVVVSRDPPQG